MKSIGDRMKNNYESVTDYHLIKRMPAIIRLDGKCFHSVTKDCNRPFDSDFMDSMYYATQQLITHIQGFKLAYIQSDEVSVLLSDYDALQTEGWFNYEIRKIISISAAIMSVEFSYAFERVAFFDSRVFNVPREEVANYFLWRALDWQRNSIQMYAQSFFSHKQLHKKNQEDMHEMLHSIDRNWTTDLSNREKNGQWILKDKNLNCNILPKYEQIKSIIPQEIFNEEA